MTTHQEQLIIDRILRSFEMGQDYVALMDTFLREARNQTEYDRRAQAVSEFMSPVTTVEVMQMDASLIL